jgi:MATE family multidrug resistance protein
MLAILAYIVTMREARALGVFARPPRDRAAETQQRRIGFAAGASNFFEVASFAAMNVIAGWVGGLTVAAWTAVLNVGAIVFMVPLGLATATAVMVGSAYGARDEAGVRRASLIGFVVTAGFALVASASVAAVPGPIAAAFSTDRVVVAMAVSGLLLACVWFLPDCLQVVIAQALRAQGDVWAPSITHFVSYVVVMTPLAWVLAIPMRMGLNGQVWAVVLASFLSAGLLLGRFAMLSRRR